MALVEVVILFEQFDYSYLEMQLSLDPLGRLNRRCLGCPKLVVSDLLVELRCTAPYIIEGIEDPVCRQSDGHV